MSNLEQLVPPLELCKKIPQGKFADSALVWTRTWCRGEPCVQPREEANENGWTTYAPAPTLEEIMEALHSAGSINPACQFSRRSGRWLATDMDNLKADKRSPVVAALKLWFDVEGIK